MKKITKQIEEEFEKLSEDEVFAADVASSIPSDICPSSQTVDHSVFKTAKVDDHSISRKETLGDWKPGDGVMSVKNNYTTGKPKIQKRKYEYTKANFFNEDEEPELKTSNIDYFKNLDIQGLEDCSDEDVYNTFVGNLTNMVNDYECDAKFNKFAVCGSRNRCNATADDDLDIVLQYSGSIDCKELLDMINSLGLKINGIPVDIKLIKADEENSFGSWLNNSRKYDDYVLSNCEDLRITEGKKKKKKHHYRRVYGYYPYWPIPFPPPRPTPHPEPPTPPPETDPDVEPESAGTAAPITETENDNYADPSQYEKCKKTFYKIHVYVPEIGTKVHNYLENSDYVTNEKKPYVLVGTVDEEWTVDSARLIKTYTYNGKKITEDVLKQLSDGNQHEIETIVNADASYLWCVQVPKNEKVKVQTSWGETLEANRNGIPHGDGDYILADNKDGIPDMSNRWVVNGKVFKTTYEFV